MPAAAHSPAAAAHHAVPSAPPSSQRRQRPAQQQLEPSDASGGSTNVSRILQSPTRFHVSTLDDYGYDRYDEDEEAGGGGAGLLDRSAAALQRLSGMSLEALNARIERILSNAGAGAAAAPQGRAL